MSTANNLLAAVQEAETLVATGNLKQAADICRNMLDEHPDFPYGYYLMSSLFRATGTYSNALTFAQMAVKMGPDVAAFHIQQGQILFSIGDNEEAAEAFRNAHRLEPADPVPLLLWADTQAQQGKFDDAVALFARARKAKDISEIDLHEGLCYAMKGAWAEAEALFNRVIERTPDYDWGHIQKGKVLMEKRRMLEAEACFERALKCNPNAYEALHNMALVCEQQGQSEMAIRYAMQAIQSHPQGWESHMHLGNLLMAREQYDMAEQVLRQAQELQPDNVYINQLLFMALSRLNKQADAVALLEKILTGEPDNKVMQYFHAMLTGGSKDIAPPAYISSLFDSCADRFDYHLQKVLGYNVPNLLAEAVAGITDATNLSMLDLGCGTGLVAEAFHDMTGQRVGVDLSTKMIGKARTRQLYKALYAQDMVEFMVACEEPFDLVVAADVLIYIGDLAPVLQAARGVLARDGMLVFSIESEIGTRDYALKPTGRYKHSSFYIERLATEEGYTLVQKQDITLRTENYLPVMGMMYILKKITTH